MGIAKSFNVNIFNSSFKIPRPSYLILYAILLIILLTIVKLLVNLSVCVIAICIPTLMVLNYFIKLLKEFESFKKK